MSRGEPPLITINVSGQITDFIVPDAKLGLIKALLNEVAIGPIDRSKE